LTVKPPTATDGVIDNLKPSDIVATVNGKRVSVSVDENGTITLHEEKIGKR